MDHAGYIQNCPMANQQKEMFDPFEDFEQEIEELSVPNKMFKKATIRDKDRNHPPQNVSSAAEHLYRTLPKHVSTKLQQKSNEQLYAELLQRQQQERNRRIAERLSPVAKFKVQEYIKRSRMKGLQRRKFSLLMGIPSERKLSSLSNKYQFQHPLQQAVQELDSGTFPLQTSDLTDEYHASVILAPIPLDAEIELD